MNINALKNFLVIAESENMTIASEKLHIAQPPLSRQLKSFEEELGVKLFTRSRQRLHLTEEGRYLKEAGKEIMDLIDNTQQKLLDIDQGTNGTLYIGANETSSISLLSGIIKHFKNAYPNVNYMILDGNSDEIMKYLITNKIDLGLVLEPYNTEVFEGFRIYEGKYIAVMNKENPLAGIPGDTIDLSALKDAPIMVTVRTATQNIIKKHFNDIGIKPDIICEFALMSTGLSLAENNIGIALLSDTAIPIIASSSSLTYKTIINPSLVYHVSILRKRTDTCSSLDEKFWKLAKNADAV